MTFDRSESLERVIAEKLKWSKEFCTRYETENMNSSLTETRVIIEAGPRQFGSTTAVVNLFDPSKDILICYSRGTINEYNYKMFKLGKVKNESKIDFTYLVHRFSSDHFVEEDIVRKINKYTIDEYENITGQMFPISSSYITKKICSEQTSNIFPSTMNSLRGKTFKEDAVVYIDTGGPYMTKYYHNVMRLIQIIDSVCVGGPNKSVRYVIF